MLGLFPSRLPAQFAVFLLVFDYLLQRACDATCRLNPFPPLVYSFLSKQATSSFVHDCSNSFKSDHLKVLERFTKKSHSKQFTSLYGWVMT